MSQLGQLIYTQDSIFQIYRVIREEGVLDVNGIKKFWKCSHTFRKDGLLYFCREIVSIPFEEIPDEVNLSV